MGYVQWAQADNGNIPAWKMVDVDGNGNLLNPAAAAFFHAWDDDFFAQTGKRITISEAFRDIATQERLYRAYLAGTGFMAAVPHTSSHGMGLAVDVNSWVYGNSSGTATHGALVEAGHRHGWSWELVGKPSGEAWHFNYTGDPTLISVEMYDAKYNPAPTPAPTKKGSSIMKLINVTNYNGGAASAKVLIEEGRPDVIVDDGTASVIGVYITDQDTTALKSVPFDQYAGVKAARKA